MADLVVENVKKEYPTPTEPLRVLDDVSLEISRGQNAAIIGPSGSGKSTLLHILGTLEKPTWGTVRVDGEDIFEMSENEQARFRNKNIGFVFQDHHLLPQLTAIENVLVPTLANGKAEPEQIQRAKDLLQEVDLQDRINHRPAELSGGERQRVAIARALIFQPLVLLADEPTGNLDQRNAAAIGDLLIQLQKKAESANILITVTHSLELASRMERQFELADGKLANSNSSQPTVQ